MQYIFEFFIGLCLTALACRLGKADFVARIIVDVVLDLCVLVISMMVFLLSFRIARRHAPLVLIVGVVVSVPCYYLYVLWGAADDPKLNDEGLGLAGKRLWIQFGSIVVGSVLVCAGTGRLWRFLISIYRLGRTLATPPELAPPPPPPPCPIHVCACSPQRPIPCPRHSCICIIELPLPLPPCPLHVCLCIPHRPPTIPSCPVHECLCTPPRAPPLPPYCPIHSCFCDPPPPPFTPSPTPSTLPSLSSSPLTPVPPTGLEIALAIHTTPTPSPTPSPPSSPLPAQATCLEIVPRDGIFSSPTIEFTFAAQSQQEVDLLTRAAIMFVGGGRSIITTWGIVRGLYSETTTMTRR